MLIRNSQNITLTTSTSQTLTGACKSRKQNPFHQKVEKLKSAESNFIGISPGVTEEDNLIKGKLKEEETKQNLTLPFKIVTKTFNEKPCWNQ